MAKFDVFANARGAGYLLDCQADLLRDLNTRLVVPLMPLEAAPTPASRLNPIFEIDDASYVMVTQFAASVPLNELTQFVTSLRAENITIGNAIDMLLSGY